MTSRVAASNNHPIFGITFSNKYATYLGLDWKKAYLAILDDLQVKNLRLIAYWDQIEPTSGKYDFTDLDFQISEAAKRNAKVVIAVGRKLPRWPECHDPSWIKATGGEEQPQLDYITEVIKRYQSNETLEAWQIENEPFFGFGECATISKTLVERELSLVKSLDPNHPVIVTDSGEWGRFAKLDKEDILGISIYRQTDHNLFGNINLELPPQYYLVKTKWLGWLSPDVWVTEMQMEPWLRNGVDKTIIEDQLKIFDQTNFNDNIKYVSKSGFNRVYFWGVEWWAYLKNADQPAMWETAKELFRS